MDFRNRQKELAENWFRERGVSVEKTHRYIACDPKDNFIDSKECSYSDFLKKIQRNKSLRGPRNGISSQAMLANLFGHCQRDDFVRIICRLKFKNIEIQNPKCEFECDAGKWIGEGEKAKRRVQCLSVQEILSLLTSPNGEKRWISEFKTRYGLN